jgi:hypothetical protein
LVSLTGCKIRDYFLFGKYFPGFFQKNIVFSLFFDAVCEVLTENGGEIYADSYIFGGKRMP